MATENKVPFKFKKVGLVVRPQLKIKTGVEYYVRFAGPLHLGKKIDDDKEPAHLCDIVDLSTNEEMQIVVGKVMRDSLVEKYPNDTYVGKCFAFELMKVPDKRYNILKTFIEIAPDEAQVTQPKEAAPAGKK
jgi:hypothetical protein